MCGLFGFDLQGITDVQRAIIVTVLAHGNDDRGDQSWGFYDPDSRTVTRDIGSITKAPLAEFASARRGFGHTRWATAGRISVENAHPFDIGGVVGAHNGVVYNHRELNQRHGRAHEVDSMHLVSHVAERLPLDDIESYGVLVFTRDTDPTDSIFVGRWSNGELALYRTPHGVVFSSEADIAINAMRAAGIREYKRVELDSRALYRVLDGHVTLVDPEFFTCERKATQTGTWQTLGGKTAVVGKPYQRWEDWADDSSSSLQPAWDAALARWERGPADEGETDDAEARHDDALDLVRAIAYEHNVDPRWVEACIEEAGFDPYDASGALYDSDEGFNQALWASVVEELDSSELWHSPAPEGSLREAQTFLTFG